MPEIKRLESGLVNKIAAGEVIERPASVVKELVENSIDAGARRIEVVIQKAGNELIQVIDNGCGIPSDQLHLALTPHATSKISTTEDLFHVHSFGFRGEALASIAEVSQMVLKSCPASENGETPKGGAEVRAEGGTVSDPVPCGMGQGTSIEIRNLFFNTPVRRKFLKGSLTEFGHISETIVRLAIPNIDIHFILKHNGRTIYDLPPCADMRDRIVRIFGGDSASKLIPVDAGGDGVRISGYVGHPDWSRSNYSLQYFFLNKRFIRDKSLQHALVQAFRGMMMVGRYPVAFLEIQMDPELVDVNVHPTKMEVRFLESNRVYSAILSGVRNEFLRHDMKSRLNADSVELDPDRGEKGVETPRNSLDDAKTEEIRSEILGWSRRASEPTDSADDGSEFDREGDFASRSPAPPAGGSRISGPSPVRRSGTASTISADQFTRGYSPVPPFKPFEDAGRGRFSTSPRDPVGQKPVNFSGFPSESPAGDNVIKEGGTGSEGGPYEKKEETRVARTPDGKPVIQIRDRYLVFDTEEGMALIDQHALHERVLYEKIKRRFVEAGHLDSQRLLVPETIDLSPTEAACALENQKVFNDFGLLVEPFGGNTLLVTGYPPVLEGLSPSEIFSEILGVLMKRGKDGVEMEDLFDAMIRQTACKAAVKGGDRLRGDAITELLALAQEEIHSHHCPHGRPSILILSIPELDKLFKRI